MTLWTLCADVNNYDGVYPADDNWETVAFDGTRRISSWEPILVNVTKEKNSGEMLGLTTCTPVLNQKAINILQEFLKDEVVEILPLICKNKKYTDIKAINVIEMLDCIDYRKSEYKSFPDGRILRFVKYVFHSEIIKEKHIFKIVDEPKAKPFVSDEFRNKVLEAGLKGFEFELVWDSENEDEDFI